MLFRKENLKHEKEELGRIKLWMI